MERVEEVRNRWTIAGHVRVRAAGHRLQEIVTTARGNRPNPRISLDELQDRDMVCVRVIYVTAGRIFQNYSLGATSPFIENFVADLQRKIPWKPFSNLD